MSEADQIMAFSSKVTALHCQSLADNSRQTWSVFYLWYNYVLCIYIYFISVVVYWNIIIHTILRNVATSIIQPNCLVPWVARVHCSHGHGHWKHDHSLGQLNHIFLNNFYTCTYKNNYKKLFRTVGMAVPKSKGTRVGWWLLMQCSRDAPLH